MIVALVVGLGVAHVSMPAMFRDIPTDVSRVALILDALHRKELGSAVVVFGSSVIASAIDAGRLRHTLPGEPVVLNLSSAAQTLTESYLFYQEIPPAVGAIVQALTPRELVNLPRLSRNKFTAYYMYGYRPDERTRAVLASVLGAEAPLTVGAPDAAQRFRARWAVHELLNTRQWRRGRLSPVATRWMTDLSFSELFETRVPDAQFESGLALWLSSWAEPDPKAVTDTRLLIAEMNARAASRGQRFLVLVPPMHPRVREGIPRAFLAEFDAILRDARERGGVDVLDASNFLPDEGFGDCIHLLARSAPLLTDVLAERLRSGAPERERR